MSNPMSGGMPPMGGMPPRGGMPSGGPPKSVFNPNDAAVMGAKGQIRPDMTVGQFFESMGVKWGDPISSAMQKIKGQLKGASPLGNAAMKGGQPPDMPQGPAPVPTKPQEPSPAGLAGLMGR